MASPLNTAAGFVAALRGAAPYVHAHHGRVFVVAFGGDTAARADFPDLLHDLALLHSLGVKLVLVHGLRPQIDAQMRAHGLEPTFTHDLRVTNAAAMECVKAAAGILRTDIEAQLSAGLANTPMGGAHLSIAGGNWITARPVGVRSGVDHQLTGEVRHVALGAIRDVLAQDRVALLSPIGYSPSGEAFNLRAGDVAGAVAAGLGADKLIFVLDSDLRAWRRLLRSRSSGHLSLDELDTFLQHPRRKPLAAENRALLDSALAAGRHGVARVHLVGAANDGAILRELYTRDGSGLMFYADADYEALRTATLDDIGGIQALIAPLEAQGVLVPRSREKLELDIGHFDVAVRDGTVIACAATQPFPDAGMAEFACVTVHPDYRDAGYAAALLARAEARTKAAGGTGLFALTTHAPHWFIEHGFSRSQVEALPIAKRELYNWQRKSLVLVKAL
ncbi:MAG: amino-acid N-acetyltransferase [Nevskiaceae bacterium]|nr:MAG: amino-acid N-acetyltransferase [Nevskiaceae bacterium]TBR73946.1 MAG: amino-acid N-acetyltransferase [Nevskiaceae bacterium]